MQKKGPITHKELQKATNEIHEKMRVQYIQNFQREKVQCLL